MEEEKKKAYSEVVEILKLVEDEEKMEKIPFEVIELIKGNSDPSYKPLISKEIPLEEQNLREQTYIILGWIANKYWGEDIMNIEETQNKDLDSNKLQEKAEEKEDNTVMENASAYNDIEPAVLNTELPILVSNLKWYQKVKVQIIKIFRIFFKVHRSGDREGVNE